MSHRLPPPTVITATATTTVTAVIIIVSIVKAPLPPPMVHAHPGATGPMFLVGRAHGAGGQVLGEVERESSRGHVLVVGDRDGNLPPLLLVGRGRVLAGQGAGRDEIVAAAALLGLGTLQGAVVLVDGGTGWRRWWWMRWMG